MFKTLPLSHLLSSGSDLWVVQNLSHKTFGNVTLDWHLQFIARKPSSKPLLVDSSLHLPCKKVCFLPFDKPEDWIKKVREIWSRLNKPTLKVMMPFKVISLEDLSKHWEHEPLPYTINLIYDRKI